MRITIITAVYNGAETIGATLQSVAEQTHPEIEHIVVDGGSSDATLDIVRANQQRIAQVISEPDRGVYDAMNKGILRATGEVIGTLNADDIYADAEVLQRVAAAFADPQVDVCYGDLLYVHRDRFDQVVRYWRAGKFNRQRLRTGWFPPHPTFFVRRRIYERWGRFDPAYPLAGDVELMFRVLGKGKAVAAYIPEVLVRMRIGGVSNARLSTVWRQNVIIRRAARQNGIELENAMLYYARKLLSRTSQYLTR